MVIKIDPRWWQGGALSFLALTIFACSSAPIQPDRAPSTENKTPSGFHQAWMRTCAIKPLPSAWQKACDDSANINLEDAQLRQQFLAKNFNETPITTRGGLITGYYVPELLISRSYSERFRYPILGVPDDLIRGKDQERFRKIPSDKEPLRHQTERYPSAALIREKTQEALSYPNIATHPSLARAIIAWAENPIDLMNAQLQGSARVHLIASSTPSAPLPEIKEWRGRLMFAEHNGLPFRSVTAWLLQRGLIRADQANIQSLREWAKTSADIAWQAMDENPRYVFFRLEIDSPDNAPLGVVGALGVPLTAEHSVAVDSGFIPLGTILKVRFNHPQLGEVERYVVAQDAGSAIKGAARLDFYWGEGERAGILASQTKAPLGLWRFDPKE